MYIYIYISFQLLTGETMSMIHLNVTSYFTMKSRVLRLSTCASSFTCLSASVHFNISPSFRNLIVANYINLVPSVISCYNLSQTIAADDLGLCYYLVLWCVILSVS